MKPTPLNQAALVTGTLAILTLGVVIGLTIALAPEPPPMPKRSNIAWRYGDEKAPNALRTLRIGAILEQAGAIGDDHLECALLISLDKFDEAEAYATALRARKNQ